MTPIKFMVACLSLLSPNAPICQDAHHRLFLCVRDRCATVQQMSLEWRRHPRKHAEYLREVYGQ